MLGTVEDGKSFFLVLIEMALEFLFRESNLLLNNDRINGNMQHVSKVTLNLYHALFNFHFFSRDSDLTTSVVSSSVRSFVRDRNPKTSSNQLSTVIDFQLRLTFN